MISANVDTSGPPGWNVVSLFAHRDAFSCRPLVIGIDRGRRSASASDPVTFASASQADRK